MLRWSEYRAYLIGLNGQIRERFDLTATDEATARQQAKQLVDGHAVELQGCKLPGSGPVAAYSFKWNPRRDGTLLPQ
jgi:hypothetical protein